MSKFLTSPIGAILVIAGAVVLYFGYERADASVSAIAWAMILFGVLLLGIGLQRYVSAFMNPPSEPESTYAHSEVRLLIQCMGVMARADGRIDPKEVETIEEIHARMLGIAINSGEVADILAEFNEDFDIRKRLQDNRTHISPLMKRKIVQACHLVMASDLKIRDSEIGKIVEIGEALGFSRTEIDEIIALSEI